MRDYLASRGIGADRLRTVSYGEERPKHDNAREETRRLNRRAALARPSAVASQDRFSRGSEVSVDLEPREPYAEPWGPTMRFVNIYLIGYFILVLGALAALWYGGVLRHISATWVVIGLVIAVGLGIMLAISAGKPEITRE